MVEIKTDTKDLTKVERCAAHSHITGLGVSPKLEVQRIADGLVAQESARKAAGLIVKMAKNNAIGGRAVLITGEPGSGKTAIAMGMAQELHGADAPFVSITASEAYSTDLCSTEVLTQALRKAIAVRIKEEAEFMHGEVERIEVDKPIAEGGVVAGSLTLKTTDMEAKYDLGPRMIGNIQRERITVGDVVTIDKASGTIKKLGRSFNKSNNYDAQGAHVKLVPCPDGEILRRESQSHVVSLHDIDVINSRSKGFIALFSGDTGEIKPEVREAIDKRIIEWRDERKADIVNGVLFIDEAHMLDLQCFSFLNRSTEQSLSPLLVLATNRAISKVRGTDWITAHGMPTDLLDRCLIIRTAPYTDDDIADILNIRAKEENINAKAETFGILTKIARQASLRYAMQLLSVADIIARRQSQDKAVEPSDLKKAHTLFYDKTRSAKFMDSYQQHMIAEAQ